MFDHSGHYRGLITAPASMTAPSRQRNTNKTDVAPPLPRPSPPTLVAVHARHPPSPDGGEPDMPVACSGVLWCTRLDQLSADALDDDVMYVVMTPTMVSMSPAHSDDPLMSTGDYISRVVSEYHALRCDVLFMGTHTPSVGTDRRTALRWVRWVYERHGIASGRVYPHTGCWIATSDVVREWVKPDFPAVDIDIEWLLLPTTTNRVRIRVDDACRVFRCDDTTQKRSAATGAVVCFDVDRKFCTQVLCSAFLSSVTNAHVWHNSSHTFFPVCDMPWARVYHVYGERQHTAEAWGFVRMVAGWSSSASSIVYVARRGAAIAQADIDAAFARSYADTVVGGKTYVLHAPSRRSWNIAKRQDHVPNWVLSEDTPLFATTASMVEACHRCIGTFPSGITFYGTVVMSFIATELLPPERVSAGPDGGGVRCSDAGGCGYPALPEDHQRTYDYMCRNRRVYEHICLHSL
jgi:hypothetical protein